MIRTFIIDEHPLVREGLKQIFSESYEMVVADEGGYEMDTLRKIDENQCDVVIMDTYFSGIPVLDFLKDIKKIKPKLPVLVLNMRSDKDTGLRFLRAGASGSNALYDIRLEFIRIPHDAFYELIMSVLEDNL